MNFMFQFSFNKEFRLKIKLVCKSKFFFVSLFSSLNHPKITSLDRGQGRNSGSKTKTYGAKRDGLY